MRPNRRTFAAFLGIGSLALAAAACQESSEPWRLEPVGGAGGEGGTGGSGGKEEVDLDCRVGALVSSLGKERILVGASMDDKIASQGDFDLRELSLTGGIPDGGGPCGACDESCTVQGESCGEGGGCAWWGCWQWTELPPGQYVRDFIDKAELEGQIPVLTYDQFFLASGASTYEQAIAALGDPALLGRYFSDWRFFLRQIGDGAALVHLEPVLFEIARRHQSDPALLPAAVPTGNAQDCAGEEASFAGFGRCLVRMARIYAPDAKVGVHAIHRAVVDGDLFLNRDRSLDLSVSVGLVADFLLASGGRGADFVTIAPARRDAGWAGLTLDENWWWDASNTTLPNFHQAFAWGGMLSDAMELPILWWQLPLGHMKLLPGKNRAWPDNRLDYVFDHMDEVAASRAFGVTFGPGDGRQTTAASDEGNLLRRLEEHREAGGQPPCP